MVNPYQPPEIGDPNDEQRKPIQWRGYSMSGGAIVIGISIVLVIELLEIQGDDVIMVLIGLLVIGSLVGSSLIEKSKAKKK